MNIGLFFGSFNPIHTGHVIIANHILNFTPVERIWFVVSPQNPLKRNDILLDPDTRFHLVTIATAANERFVASDVEFDLPIPSYTINTLEYLRNRHSDYQFHLIVGSDNFLSFSGWKSHELLIKEQIIVYERHGFPLMQKPNLPNIQLLNPGLIDISSTDIRQLIKQGKSVRYLVPENVFAELEK